MSKNPRLDATLLLNPPVPYSQEGTVIKYSDGFRLMHTPTNKTKPDEATWFFWKHPESSVARSRGGIDSIYFSLQVNCDDQEFGGNFAENRSNFTGYELWQCRYKGLAGQEGYEENWDGPDYVPCSLVKYYQGVNTISYYEEGTGWVPHHVKTSSSSSTINNSGIISHTFGGEQSKPVGWTPESEGYKKIYSYTFGDGTDGSVYGKEEGTDVTSSMISAGYRYTTGNGLSLYARDTDLDYTYELDGDADFKCAFNPRPYGGNSPFSIRKRYANGTIKITMIGFCDYDRDGIQGKAYNIVVAYDKYSCSVGSAKLANYNNDFEFSKTGSGTQNFTYTISHSSPLGQSNVATFTWELPENEARQITDFYVDSIT